MAIDPSFSPGRYVLGVVLFFGAIVGLTFVASNIADRMVAEIEVNDTKAVSDTAEFYSRLKVVNGINIRLVSTTLSPMERIELDSERIQIESEMRQIVQRIPPGFRTSQMYPYCVSPSSN